MKSAVAMFLVACNLGSASLIVESGPVFTEGSFADAGGSPVSVVEPSAVCEPGGSCQNALITCEYGEHPRIECNASLLCNGKWELEKQAPVDSGCAMDCPVAYTEALPDGGCSDETAATTLCEYPEGTCGCSTEADAGDAGAGRFTWTCIRPAAGCPRTRPRIGTSCVKPMTCDYGTGVFPEGVAVSCSGEQWRLATPSHAAEPTPRRRGAP